MPSFKDVGDYDLYYYVEGNDEYNDLGSEDSPMYLKVKIEVDKSDWGTIVIRGGHANYVKPNGETSAEVDKNGVIWLQEDSDGISTWYGLDNSSGTFALGSRFYVRWLEPGDDDYPYYYALLDDETKQMAEEGKLWIFLTGVYSPDGEKYEKLDINVPYYIQIGDDWDEEDVNAWYISTEEDERIRADINTVAGFNAKYADINFPDSSAPFARLLLRHFSPYSLLDLKTNAQSSSTNKSNSTSKNSNNMNTSSSGSVNSSATKSINGSSSDTSLLTRGLGVSTGTDMDNSQISQMVMLLMVLVFFKLNKKHEFDNV